MYRLTPEERLQIVKRYYENNGSVRQTMRALRPIYGRHNRPSESLIRSTMDRFHTTFTLVDNRHPQRRRTVRTAEAIAAVEHSVEDDPNESIRRRAQQLEMCPSTTWKILRKDLGLKAYKIQLVHEIKPRDHAKRRTFAAWAENNIALDPNFQSKILFSDEAHFWLNGYVNKQNCRIWSDENPREFVEEPLYPKKLTVWCALWAGGIIGPYFFKDDAGNNVTVNGERYRAMITDFFLPHLNDIDVEDYWFQQDGATCHTAHDTIHLLSETFEERLISRHGPVNWPPRSCDITPVDYFLWGYVKSKVYADKPQTLDALEVNIRRVIANIRPEMLEKVIENWISRLRFVRASRGAHMPQIIFKQ